VLTGEGDPQPGAALLELVAVMDRLRRECPWDAKQTHLSLRPYLLEETYETLDALDRGNLAELRDELGDLLLQVIFHARVAAERTDGTGFDIDDVAKGIATKLIRRHPHVFADVKVADADEVRRNWNQIKAAERAAAVRAAAVRAAAVRAAAGGAAAGGAAAGGGTGSVLDGVPLAQPALALAAQLQRRAEAAGAPDEVADLPVHEVAATSEDQAGSDAFGSSAVEVTEAGPGDQAVSELGAELFVLVSRARAAGLNPELELRHAALVFSDRVRAWETDSHG
jgi:XTP/dITP diphosphohydrolase